MCGACPAFVEAAGRHLLTDGRFNDVAVRQRWLSLWLSESPACDWAPSHCPTTSCLPLFSLSLHRLPPRFHVLSVRSFRPWNPSPPHPLPTPLAQFSWYTKRAGLATLYHTIELYWLTDSSADAAATSAFARRTLGSAASADAALSGVGAQLGAAARAVAATAEGVLGDSIRRGF